MNTTTLKAIIVDDEPDSIKMLELQLKAFCPEIEVAATFTSSLKATDVIDYIKPDILFLDIEMPQLSGFDLLERLHLKNCSVVFVTAYNQYALKAIKFNALDYLLKPVEESELIAVVKKALQQKPTETQLHNFKQLMQGITPSKVAIHTATGIMFVAFDEILYVESNNNYTQLFLTNNKKYLLSKSLKEVQDILEESHFLRIHRQYIINLNQVKELHKKDTTLTLNNNITLPVARTQMGTLTTKFMWL
jgi:two-component system LytT family response regulator